MEQLGDNRHGALYSTVEVVQASGASYRQLDYWARTGVLEPARPAAGSGGTTRGYTLVEAVAAGVLAVVCTVGKDRQLPHGVLAAVNDAPDNAFIAIESVTHGRAHASWVGADAALERVRRAGALMLIDLDGLKMRVELGLPRLVESLA